MRKEASVNHTTQEVQIEFHRSLGMSVAVTLSLLGLAEDVEGFDQWIYSTYASLSEDLRSDIRTIFKPFGNVLMFDGLLADHAEIESLPALIAWLNGLSAERVDASNLVCLRNLAQHHGLAIDSFDASTLRDRQELAGLLPGLLRDFPHLSSHVESLADILYAPEAMKAQLVYIITRFWERHYRTVYERCRTIEETSIRTLRSKTQNQSFAETFLEFTGRTYPEAHGPELASVKSAVFVPTCHEGPYVSVDSLFGDEKTLTVVYNCRTSGEADPHGGLPIEELFPPLKALADETRLEILGILAGKELYAQQIVDRMTVSQSAVSRHLRLMVACGILRERRQDGMKFYTVDTKSLGRLGEALAAIQGQASDTP